MTIATYSVGQPCWADLGTSDVDQTREFYVAVMGWAVSPGNPDFGGYATAEHNGALVAGLGPQMGDAPVAWLLYFATSDADATQGAIVENGGTVIVPAHQVGDLGRLVIASDPTGAVFGLWEAEQMPGFGAIGRAGAFAWCDLRTDQPDAAREFYGAVFGWEYSAVPMAGDEYTTFTTVDAGAPSGGVGPMMGAEGAPPHWLLYFAVDDVDTAVATAVTLNGTSLAPPFDTPFGRMRPIVDSGGAPLWLMTLPEG